MASAAATRPPRRKTPPKMASLRPQYPLRRTRLAPPGQSTSERLVGDSVSKGMGAVKSSRKSIALGGRPLRQVFRGVQACRCRTRLNNHPTWLDRSLQP
jgi:hypothetical protein